MSTECLYLCKYFHTETHVFRWKIDFHTKFVHWDCSCFQVENWLLHQVCSLGLFMFSGGKFTFTPILFTGTVHVFRWKIDFHTKFVHWDCSCLQVEDWLSHQFCSLGLFMFTGGRLTFTPSLFTGTVQVFRWKIDFHTQVCSLGLFMFTGGRLIFTPKFVHWDCSCFQVENWLSHQVCSLDCSCLQMEEWLSHQVCSKPHTKFVRSLRGRAVKLPAL